MTIKGHPQQVDTKWRMRRSLRKLQKTDLKTALFLWEMEKKLEVEDPPPMLVHLLERLRRCHPREAELLDKAAGRL